MMLFSPFKCRWRNVPIDLWERSHTEKNSTADILTLTFEAAPTSPLGAQEISWGHPRLTMNQKRRASVHHTGNDVRRCFFQEGIDVAYQ